MTPSRLIKAYQRVRASRRLEDRRLLKRQYDPASRTLVLDSGSLLGKRGGEAYVWERAYAQGLARAGLTYGYLTDCSVRDRVIFWSPSERFNPFGFPNYARSVCQFAAQLEAQGNMLWPSSADMAYWESKADMHRRFRDLGVPTPETTLCRTVAEALSASLPYPVLFKGDHSCASRDVEYCANRERLQALLADRMFFQDETIVLQSVVPASRDMRIVFVGEDIALAFWRIKKNSQIWTTTATAYGSAVDFGNFPERWRSFISTHYLKLGLKMGGIDLIWNEDDLTRPPLFLEVSPVFSPNPPVDLTGRSYDYGAYKKKLFLRDSYRYEQAAVIYSLAETYVRVCVGKAAAHEVNTQ